MSRSLRAISATRLACALGVLLSARAALAASGGGEASDAYERLAGEVLAEALFADRAPAFRPPPWLEQNPAPNGRDGGTSASASWILLSDEFGAADRFAGTGSGVEVRLDLRRPSGWGGSLAFSTVERGVYSVVDDRPVRVERYLLGAIRAPARPGRWSLSGGAGIAWNAFDIDGAPPALDIEGAGGYAELLVVGLLGRRCRLEASGRAIYWRGKDGLGGSGAELSLVLGVGIGVRF
ncbi:MAG: hypothetical protein ACYS9X_07880 [Planctomycetota bacterium]